MAIKIYHNPRCSKSRQTLSILQEKGVEPEVVEYLKTPPDHETLDRVLTLLGLAPMELIRKGEAEYKELGLKDTALSRSELIDIMVAHPKLIERPIVINGDRAIIGRPPEQVIDIL